jgi:hypothetical protein
MRQIARAPLTSLLENFWLDPNLLGQSFAGVESAHESTSDVVLAVPLDLLARLTI